MATPKQESFARFIVEGMNPSEAYKAAGYKAKKPETVATEAKRLLNNPQITPIIEKLRSEAMKQSAWKLADAIDQVKQLTDKAFHELMESDFVDPKALSAYLQCLDRLNKYTDVEHVIDIRRSMYGDLNQDQQDFMPRLGNEVDYMGNWNSVPPMEQIEDVQ